MDAFLGTHTPRLDDKGRLFLPARYRAELAGGLVVTTGQEGCLYVFPTAEFHRISAEMQAAPGSSRPVRDFVRVFRASAHPDTPDRQGRITIPAPLRAYARLDKDCTVIGNGNRLEVWDSTAWADYLAEVMPAYSAYSVPTQEVVPGL
ncbi:division/cell wall cluster transcriptional repressor MraZ [Fodinibacter luteus]|uniref:Transcriptional regulator MraZ n=1 Tax=Fodinibacter luteus TaxID=552064 RepID=A0ABP8KHU6_9MICO